MGLPYSVPFLIGPIPGLPYTVPFTLGTTSFSVSINGRGSFTPTATRYLVPLDVVCRGTGTLAPTIRLRFLRSPASSGRGVLTVAARLWRITSPAHMGAHGILTVTTRARFLRTGAFTGNGKATATARMYGATTSVATHGTGRTTVVAMPKSARTVSAIGHGVLSAQATSSAFSLIAALSGSGALSIYTYPPARGEVSGAGHLVVTAVVGSFTLVSAPEGRGILAASASVVLSAQEVGYGTGELTVTGYMYSINTSVPSFGNGRTSVDAYVSFIRSPAFSSVGILSALIEVTQLARTSAILSSGVLRAGTSVRFSFGTLFHARGGLVAKAHDSLISLVETIEWYNLVGSSVSVQMVRPPDDERARAIFYLANPLWPNEIGIVWRNGDLVVVWDGIIYASVAYDPLRHQYQRIRESLGVLHFETSNDGVFWGNLLCNAPAPDWVTTLHVGLKIKSPGTVVYDNLRVPSARPAFTGPGQILSTAQLYGWHYEIAASMDVTTRSVTGVTRSTETPAEGQFFVMWK